MIPHQIEQTIDAQSTGKQVADRCDLRGMLLCRNRTAEEDTESPRVNLATAIFALTYMLVSLGENSPRKLDRPMGALLGAVLMVMTDSLTRAEATAALDFSALAVLFGMMVLLTV